MSGPPISEAPSPDLAVTIAGQRIRALSLDGQPRQSLLVTTVRVENMGAAAATTPTVAIGRIGLLTAFTSEGVDCETSDETGGPSCTLPSIDPGGSLTLEFTDFISPLDMSHVTEFEITVTANGDANAQNDTARKARPFVPTRIVKSTENPNEVCVFFQSIPLYTFVIVTADNVRGPYTQLSTIESQGTNTQKIVLPRDRVKRFIRLIVVPTPI